MLGLVLAAAFISSPDCRAIDGDTLVCRVGLERVHLRLNGIDSPELHSCPYYRHCAPGDPYAAKDNAARLIAGRTVTWRDLGTDRYGRTIAEAYAGGVDISCAQLRGGYAIYRGDWDNGKTLKGACR